MTPTAKRYLGLLEQGYTLRQIAEMCDKEYYTVYQAVRYWTDPVYREKVRTYSNQKNREHTANNPAYREKRAMYLKRARDKAKA
jgi:hypothetical protein